MMEIARLTPTLTSGGIRRKFRSFERFVLRAVIPSPSDVGPLPTNLIWLFAALCIAPELLRLAGMNFGCPTPHIDVQTLTRFTRQAQLIDQFHVFLEGSFLHNLHEGTGVCVALRARAIYQPEPLPVGGRRYYSGKCFRRGLRLYDANP